MCSAALFFLQWMSARVEESEGRGGKGREMWRKFSRFFITYPWIKFWTSLWLRILLTPEGSSFKQMYTSAFWHSSKHFSNLAHWIHCIYYGVEIQNKRLLWPGAFTMPSIISKVWLSLPLLWPSQKLQEINVEQSWKEVRLTPVYFNMWFKLATIHWKIVTITFYLLQHELN